MIFRPWKKPIQIGCCGADGSNDYITMRQPLPSTCRDTVTGNAFFHGCVDELTWLLEDKSGWVAGLAMTLAFIQVCICIHVQCKTFWRILIKHSFWIVMKIDKFFCIQKLTEITQFFFRKISKIPEQHHNSKISIQNGFCSSAENCVWSRKFAVFENFLFG